jgi:hypothetical protein
MALKLHHLVTGARVEIRLTVLGSELPSGQELTWLGGSVHEVSDDKSKALISLDFVERHPHLETGKLWWNVNAKTWRVTSPRKSKA